MRYRDTDSETRSTEIETEQTFSLIQSSLGIRFFNTKNFSSTFAVTVFQYDNFEIESDASRGDIDFELTNIAEVTRDNTSLNIGLAYVF